MSMHTHVVGFRPPDEKWHKMKAAYDACKAAGLDVPEEVRKFFNDRKPDPRGVEIDDRDLIACGAVTEYKAEMRDGFEIHVDKLPEGVTVVRVVNSY